MGKVFGNSRKVAVDAGIEIEALHIGLVQGKGNNQVEDTLKLVRLLVKAVITSKQLRPD